jgi:hypothetical protein
MGIAPRRHRHPRPVLPPDIVGIYYVAQNVASLPAKLKTSFDPILARSSPQHRRRRQAAVAKQVRQVGFWVIAAQSRRAGARHSGEAVMGLVGAAFVAGTAALGFLLAAEVVAATARSASALIYCRPPRNMIISLVMIACRRLLRSASSCSCAAEAGRRCGRRPAGRSRSCWLGFAAIVQVAAAGAYCRRGLGLALAADLGERRRARRLALSLAPQPRMAELCRHPGDPRSLSASSVDQGLRPEDRELFRMRKDESRSCAARPETAATPRADLVPEVAHPGEQHRQPASSAAAMTSSSRIDRRAGSPRSLRLRRSRQPSANGKKASDATPTDRARLGPAMVSALRAP